VANASVRVRSPKDRNPRQGTETNGSSPDAVSCPVVRKTVIPARGRKPKGACGFLCLLQRSERP